MNYRTVVCSILLSSTLIINSGNADAAPLFSPRAAPQKQAMPQPAQPSPADQKNFTINAAAGVYFQAGIGITSTGDLTVDLTIPTAPAQKTPPVAVYLRNETTGQMSASATIASVTGRVSYQLKPTDFPAGAAVYSVLIGSSVPFSGSAVITFPKTNNVQLNNYLNRLSPQQKQALTAVLNMPVTPSQKLPATASAAAGRSASLPEIHGKAGDGIIDGPIPFAVPVLQSRPGSATLKKGGGDISRKIISKAAPIQFKPFQLDEVFDMNTGKPLFPVNLPAAAANSQKSIKYAQRTVSDLAELQRRGVTGASIGQGGTYGLKGTAGTFSLSSQVVIPRSDGTSLTIPVSAYLKELNALERGLNSHGATMRNAQTGKISAVPGEATIASVAINKDLIKKQRIEFDKKIIKGLPQRPWAAADITSRHQKAIAKLPSVSRGARNQLVSSAPANPVIKAVPGLQKSSSMAAKTAAGPSKINPNVIRDTRCELANVFQQEGGNYDAAQGVGEGVILKITKYDPTPGACVLTFEDSTGKTVDQPITNYNTFEITSKVPATLAKGPGTVTLRDKRNPWGSTVPFYVGKQCSIDSVYPPVSMPGSEVTLKVGRFRGCDVSLADNFAGHSAVIPNRYVNPNEITIAVPSFTLGKNKIEARLAPVIKGNIQPLSSAVDFKIIPAAADPGGNSPPPDYFARGIKPFERIYRTDPLLYGDPNNIAVDVNAQFSISSKGATPQGAKAEEAREYDNLVWFKGDAAVRGMLFGSDPYEIIGAHASASIPTANSEDSKLRANFVITTGSENGQGGLAVYTWRKSKDQTNGATETTDPQDCEEVREDGSCIRDGANVTVQFKYSNDIKVFTIDKKVETSFMVGSVPFVARVGFHGEAGTKVKFALSPLQVIGQATPYVRTTMYAECAVELLFLKAGVGVDMILANLDLDGAAQVYLDFGQMALITELYVHYTYDLLNGTLYAFVEGPGNFRYKHDIFNINDMLSQNAGIDLSILKGNGYLVQPYLRAFQLLPDV